MESHSPVSKSKEGGTTKNNASCSGNNISGFHSAILSLNNNNSGSNTNTVGGNH